MCSAIVLFLATAVCYAETHAFKLSVNRLPITTTLEPPHLRKNKDATRTFTPKPVFEGAFGSDELLVADFAFGYPRECISQINPSR